MNSYFAKSLLMGASAVVFATASAQTPSNNAPPAEDELAEVAVTGSRIITNGNNSPTPVTVVTVEELQATHPSTVFEALLDLPAFAGSRGTTSVPSRSSAGGNNNQISALNLRGLGAVRTLVLYDGHRVPATQQDGLVDANTIPQLLLQRVDVVTGGASAVYGSDAIGGVVNFVTDRNFNGLKFDAQTGVSHEDDARAYQVGVAYGTDLFGGRGHVEGSVQSINDDGIAHRTDRQEFLNRWSIQGAGTSALPYFLVANATTNSWTWGGKITAPANNPLRNQQFISGGVLVPFINGSTVGLPANSVTEIGGDGAYDTSSSIKSKTDLHQIYARFDFDATDNLHYFLTASGTLDHNFNWFGNANIQNVMISATNPYLGTNYQQQMTAAGIARFVFSKKYSVDSPVPQASNDFYTRSLYFNTGLEGNLGAYKWEAAYTRSDVKLDVRGNFTFNNGRLYAALDAARDASGNIVCRVTITNPGLYPGCLPLNVFGPNSENPAAVDWARQRGYSLSKMPTDDLAGSFTGSPFNNWAGPVGMALSGEWRRQGFELASTNAPVNYSPLDCTGLTTTGNCTPATATNVGTPLYNGATAPRPPVSMTISEAALETDVPILKDLPFAQSVNLNLAYRYAKYSVEGSPDINAPSATTTFNTNTWKAGLDWHFNDVVTVRATRSRDIRAPNLFELFQPNATTFTLANRDLLTGSNATGTGALPAVVNGGNPNLRPEIAATTTVGLVLRPTENFSLAIDAFQIKVTDFISRINGYDAPIQSACYAGNAFYCTLQQRPGPITNTSTANAVTRWSVLPLNIAELSTRGVDVEANYKTTLIARPLALRGMVTYQPHVLFSQPGTTTLDYGGAHGTPEASGAAGPRLRVAVFAHYSLTDSFAIDWLTRWRDKMHLLPDPTLFAAPNTDARAVAYSNLTLSHRLSGPFAGQSNVYLNIQNVFNQPAPITASYSTSAQPGLYGGYAPGDDPIGRYYNLGVRFRL